MENANYNDQATAATLTAIYTFDNSCALRLPSLSYLQQWDSSSSNTRNTADTYCKLANWFWAINNHLIIRHHNNDDNTQYRKGPMGKNASIRVQTERGNKEEVKDLAERSETLNWLSSIASTQTFQVTSAWKPTICCSHLCVHTRRKCFLFSYNNTMIQCLCVCNIPW